MAHPHAFACPAASWSRTTPRALAVVVATLMPISVGCQKSEPTPKAKPAKKMKIEKKEAAAQPSDATCIGAWSTAGATTQFKAAGHTFEKAGSQLKQTDTDPDAKITLGVMANTKEDTEDNLANIKAILEFFKAEGVEAIVVAGDLGESEGQIKNVLNPIAAEGLPTFVVIGNRERKVDFNNAVEAVAKTHPGLVNLNFVRLAALDDVTLVSVPGYYDKSYIHAQDGCHYQSGDLKIVQEAMSAATKGKPVVLVSHGPPKQEGPDAIDRTLEQANVGDPALTAAIKSAGIPFGIFANIQEAGGRATDPTGKTVVAPQTAVSAMYLNPGATDSVSWQMNDGTRSVGMAATMTIDGGKASYKVFRIPEKG